MQESPLMLEYLPIPQVRQESAPMVLDAPGGQFLQELSVVAAGWSLYLPAAQPTQKFELLAPCVELYFPVGQGLQSVLPAALQ